MDRLNYHHLRYFREVAREGNLTRAAARLNLSQSALSTQIKQLEARFGRDLFARTGRTLTLTEAGALALAHADRIFAAGEELVATLATGDRSSAPLRVGASATLSRNFQLRFLRPVLDDAGLVLAAGSQAALLERLKALELDVVLATEPPAHGAYPDLVAHRVADEPVGLFGRPERLDHATLADLLKAEPVIAPTESAIRIGFDSLAARLGAAPRIAAEVDDMAMVRLLAREGVGLALVPPVVVTDEVAQGLLAQAPFPLDITETFYAVTARRGFPHPALDRLIGAGQ